MTIAHARLALLALVAALAPAACGPSSDAPTPPVAEAEPEELRLAYDLSLSGPVQALLTGWPAEHPNEPVASRADASTALSVQAEAGSAEADVLIMSEQTPLPDGEHAPIAVRPWARDPIILFTAANPEQEPARSARDIFEDETARVAIAVEASPLGQYTRFGFRKLERWEQVKPRLLRFSDAAGVIEAVASRDAAMGVAYASDLAEADRNLERLEELVVSNASERSFVVVTLTARGIDLARWLAEPEQVEQLASFGLEPVSTRPDLSD